MIHDFINDIAKAWSVDTCVAPDEWTPERPAVGQCAVTALLVQEILGGEILRCEITDGSHYWNRLENGVEIDLTAGQFEEAIERRNVESRTREQLLASLSTRVRFERLRQTYSDNGSSNSLLIQNEHRKGDE